MRESREFGRTFERQVIMARIRHSSEQIIGKLRDADVLLGQGMKVPEASKQLGISEQTYYCWRQMYGGMDPQMAKELRELQKENAQLKQLMQAGELLDLVIALVTPDTSMKPTQRKHTHHQ